MSTDLVFRIALAVIGLVYTAIRIYYTRLAMQSDRNFFRPRGDLGQLVFGTLGFLNIVPTVIYVVAPEQLVWAALPLPAGWRWFGVGLGLLGIFLLLWLHRTLDKYSSVPGVAKDSHRDPGSPGRARGIARVIAGPDDFHRFQPCDVLVAHTTTPIWTPLFNIASAAITEVGGPFSHTAIVAREFGIPLVNGAIDATRVIADGTPILVDGSAGYAEL